MRFRGGIAQRYFDCGFCRNWVNRVCFIARRHALAGLLSRAFPLRETTRMLRFCKLRGAEESATRRSLQSFYPALKLRQSTLTVVDFLIIVTRGYSHELARRAERLPYLPIKYSNNRETVSREAIFVRIIFLPACNDRPERSLPRASYLPSRVLLLQPKSKAVAI